MQLESSRGLESRVDSRSGPTVYRTNALALPCLALPCLALPVPSLPTR